MEDREEHAKRPSALGQVEAIGRKLRRGRLAVFLDYDGTLTPIVARPEDAVLPEAMRSLLRELNRRCTVAVVSGRDRRNVAELVGLDVLVYAGSHGFDIRGPGFSMQKEEAQAALPDLDRAEQKLAEQTRDIAGVLVERKRFAIAVHYRQTPAASVGGVERIVKRIADEHPSLRLKGGKKIFELQPNIEWDKGEAVLWLRKALGVDDPEVLTIYIGDDLTDEDAFRALAENDCGWGILVGDGTTDTQARYVLSDTVEVEEFLRRVLDSASRRAPSA